MKLFKKKNISFKKVPNQEGFSLENQNGKMNNVRDIDIEEYLDDMFSYTDQYVILTSPKVQNKVRFVQACMMNGKVEVEILVEDQEARLYYKLCSQEECYRIFLDFYDQILIVNMEEYQPVEFL